MGDYQPGIVPNTCKDLLKNGDERNTAIWVIAQKKPEGLRFSSVKNSDLPARGALLGSSIQAAVRNWVRGPLFNYLPIGICIESAASRVDVNEHFAEEDRSLPDSFVRERTGIYSAGRGGLCGSWPSVLQIWGKYMKEIYELVKDRDTFFVESNISVLEAARYMTEKNVGAVAVVRVQELVGIFSERDLMKRVVSEGLDPRKTRVEDVMTKDPFVVSPHETLDKCMRLMKEHNFRHLPVCDGRKLKGLISLRDLLLHDLVEKEGEVHMMRAYISQG